MAVSEHCFTGKKMGQLRAQIVFNSITSVLKKYNIIFIESETSFILLKLLIDNIFITNKTKLTNTFNEIFDITKSLLSLCMK